MHQLSLSKQHCRLGMHLAKICNNDLPLTGAMLAIPFRALDQQQVATLELDSSTGSQKPVAGLTSSDCSESSGTSKSPFTGVEVPIALVPGKLAWPTASCSQSAGSFNKSSLDGTKEGKAQSTLLPHLTS